MTDATLNHRALQILRVLVEQYLNQGQPVSSKCLAQVKSIAASSATVRNVMMTLERSGLLTSAHTSAGRIPTVSGLRLFVDELLTLKNFEDYRQENRFNEFAKQVKQGYMSASELCEQANNWLANASQLTSVVSIADKPEVAVEKVEFVQLSDQRLMAIIVLKNGEIQNKIIDLTHSIKASDVTRTAALMNMVLAGKTLSQGYQSLQILARSDAQLKYLSDVALGQQTETDDKVTQLMVAGQNYLLNESISPELSRVRAVFEAISNKNLVMDIMQRCRDENGIKIFIGEETGIDLLSECALVSAPYQCDGKVIGRLAVIGPARMDYRKVIPIVDMTSKLLTSALNHTR
ncbi:heat-inducible transcriptional repressor HrcA [Catenovulum adriaticum]|uniref:Heat-inducible transcription repressor HrcA n=1 Tax=Catenovulum adriaticum TaxID=2984846 RepID=A0ABY7APF4_9ALTE|nr:heat-inducible transcriptional repressor HrcA [Catenovulum sp. TS8]WAJ71108.1 heat-inducible transcriptional repressor HrcA [Catenovulum sp. TS8]